MKTLSYNFFVTQKKEAEDDVDDHDGDIDRK